MAEFLAELRRRHIFRIGGIYVVVAWGVAQVVDLLSQTYALPDWIAQPLLAVLAIGFPFTLLAAWLIVGAAKAGDSPTELKKATVTDWALIAAFALVIVLIGYQRIFPRDFATSDTTASNSAPASIADDIVEQVENRLPNSVAVLPLENLSPDPNDAYFAAGVHEEIISQLAKIHDLRVIARTSVMDYPESGKPIPVIADELNVEMIMEGSVRYAGDAIRVTAQLIDGRSNTHLWTETYDGELSDIFGIQADIATQIAEALEVEILASDRESIEGRPTNSPEAYAEYLKAITLIKERRIAGIRGLSQVHEYLDLALELDPEFALAHAWKAYAYSESRLRDPVPEQEWPRFRAEMERLVDLHADMALALDPTIADAHAFRAFQHFYTWRAEPALFEAEQTLRRNPNNGRVFNIVAQIAAFIGDDPEKAAEYQRRYVELDPNSGAAWAVLGDWLHQSGRYAEAIEALEHCLALTLPDSSCALWLARSEIVRGNRDAAVDALRLAEDLGNSRSAQLAYAYGLLGENVDAQRIFNNYIESPNDKEPPDLAWAHMGIGDYNEALNQLRLAAENLEALRTPYAAHYIRLNVWSDPTLERPDFVEARENLRAR